jgi:predicted nucleic acid-binding Zn finger protein
LPSPTFVSAYLDSFRPGKVFIIIWGKDSVTEITHCSCSRFS